MNKLNNYFPNIYCINLPESTIRRQHMEHQFRKIGVHEHVTYTCANKPADNIFLPNMINSGQWGCTLSHMMVLGHALKNANGHIVIFEDDVEFNLTEMQRLHEIMDYIDNNGWDLFYLGGQPTKKVERTKVQNLYKTRTMRGTYAYAVNKNSIFKLYEHFINMLGCAKKHSGICDYILGSYANNPNNKTYATYPLLARPIATYSIIQEKEHDHNPTIHERWNNALG